MITTTLRVMLGMRSNLVGWDDLLIGKSVKCFPYSEFDKEFPESELGKEFRFPCLESELDKEFPISDIMKTNNLMDTLWVFRFAMIDQPEMITLCRKFSVWCVRQIEDVTLDGRSERALDVAWRHTEGQATDLELSRAKEEAWAAATQTRYISAERSRYNCLADVLAHAAHYAVVPCGVVKVVLYTLQAVRAEGNPIWNLDWRIVEEKLTTKLKQILDSGKWVED